MRRFLTVLFKSFSVVVVPGWELLDSRWNGNEALRWDTDRGAFFVKMNRVEDVSVFMTEVSECSGFSLSWSACAVFANNRGSTPRPPFPVPHDRRMNRFPFATAHAKSLRTHLMCGGD